jgi:hypothetical protein
MSSREPEVSAFTCAGVSFVRSQTRVRLAEMNRQAVAGPEVLHGHRGGGGGLAVVRAPVIRSRHMPGLGASEMLLAVHRASKRALGPATGPSASLRGSLPPQILKQGDCINRNLTTCPKPDTLDSSFDPALPHYGSLFPPLGEQAEPVKPRCMGELVFVPWGLCVRSACST